MTVKSDAEFVVVDIYIVPEKGMSLNDSIRCAALTGSADADPAHAMLQRKYDGTEVIPPHSAQATSV
jgi:hypothetical protein